MEYFGVSLIGAAGNVTGNPGVAKNGQRPNSKKQI